MLVRWKAGEGKSWCQAFSAECSVALLAGDSQGKEETCSAGSDNSKLTSAEFKSDNWLFHILLLIKGRRRRRRRRRKKLKGIFNVTQEVEKQTKTKNTEMEFECSLLNVQSWSVLQCCYFFLFFLKQNSWWNFVKIKICENICKFATTISIYYFIADLLNWMVTVCMLMCMICNLLLLWVHSDPLLHSVCAFGWMASESERKRHGWVVKGLGICSAVMETIQYSITLLPSVSTLIAWEECFVVPSTLMTHSLQS